jgi:prepilin-type N-terminal cleavage/methylation domain-containing protein
MPNMNRQAGYSPGASHTSTGMTLVEVLVALMILSIALIVFLTVLPGVSQGSQKGSYIAIATRAAADQITLAQTTNTSLLNLGTNTYTVAGLPSGSMTVTIGGDLTANNASLKEVDVTVTWSGTTYAPSTAGSVSLSTYVCGKR